ncbi:MAG: hypothetical protein IPI44_10640 [Sulfuritalea sp.]|nr:hypothetical protein [Sulfuritalea sp.]
MTPFTQLPGFTRSPPGLERAILRRLPAVLVLGTLASALPSLVARLFPWQGSAVEVATLITTIDIYGISLAILHWTVVFTLAIGAFTVMVMKGPAYVADAYPLEDSETPDPPGKQAHAARPVRAAPAKTRQRP